MEPTAEAKAEAPKAETPKEEEAKAEVPKSEEPKAAEATAEELEKEQANDSNATLILGGGEAPEAKAEAPQGRRLTLGRRIKLRKMNPWKWIPMY